MHAYFFMNVSNAKPGYNPNPVTVVCFAVMEQKNARQYRQE
jgi:hypothetical protein